MPDWEALCRDPDGILQRYLRDSDQIHLATVDQDGVILQCNDALCEKFGARQDRVVGRSFWDRLPADDVEHLRQRIRETSESLAEPFLLNFISADNIPFTLQCVLEIQPDGFILIGEPPQRRDEHVAQELMTLNNQLAVLSRENERKRKALAKTEARLQAALAELETSYWHLKKIQEVLPTCMDCGKVKTGEHSWDNAIEYLRQNALFLSHGYCPACEKRVMAKLEAEP